MDATLEAQETPTPFLQPSTAHSQQATIPGSPKPKERSAEDQKQIIDEALERYKISSDADKDNIDAAKEDVKFVFKSGSQWTDEVRKRWGNDPVLEFPQLKQFVNQVVNDQRQNRPGIRVHPAGAQASMETAEVLQGLVRGIENDSQGEAVYDTGYQHAVVGGRGFWRVITEYESPSSFNQVLRLRAIVDPSTVRMDLDFQEPDASDCNYYFITETVQKEAFEQRWPDADALSWKADGDNAYWYDGKDTVIVADYYRRVSVRRQLVMLVNGTQGFLDELEKQQGKIPKQAIKAQRETDDYKVEWFKIAGGESILEEFEWPGRTIPVICCMGDNIMIDGKRVFQGLIRQARDAQRMYNYEKSLKALLISMYPLAPFIASDEAVENRENMWDSANTARWSTLIYNAKDENGNKIDPPQRMQFGAVPAALSEMMASDKEDLKSVIGMYESSLGQRSQEVSGRAILAREKQGDAATFHFADNHSRAIALTGRISIECAPTFYDTQRLVTIIKPDDSHDMVVLNQQGVQQDPLTGMMVQAIVKNDISKGEFAVTVEAGPSYATAREQSRDYIMQLIQADPSLLQVAGDVLVKTMDFADGDEIAERIQLMMPPPIQAHIKMKQQGIKIPASVTQQMGQMQQQLTQAQQTMQQMQQKIQQLQSGADEKVAVAKINQVTDIATANIANDTKLIMAGIDPRTYMPLPGAFPQMIDPNTGMAMPPTQPQLPGMPPQGGPPPQGMPPQGGPPPQGGMPPQGGPPPPDPAQMQLMGSEDASNLPPLGHPQPPTPPAQQ